MTPEQIHLALNHVPILGCAFALIPILTGLFRRNSLCLISGLIIAMLSGWMTPLVMETGEEAYERYEHGTPAAYLDADAEKYLHFHEERAERGAVSLYLTAVLSTIALVATVRSWSCGKWLAMAAAVACMVSFLSGIWIADSGGDIRRPDFRSADDEMTKHDHS